MKLNLLYHDIQTEALSNLSEQKNYTKIFLSYALINLCNCSLISLLFLCIYSLIKIS